MSGLVTRAQRAPAPPRKCTTAFTLIEVLVVASIIALLIAVLLPSLKRARIQAMLTTDKANSKQIATAVAEYQSESKEYYPIMFNWYLTTHPGSTAPAKTCYLSLALRQYERGLRYLKDSIAESTGDAFDPEQCWSDYRKRDEYELRFLPEHYVCPFVRGRDPWELRQVGTAGAVTLWEWRGIMECYQTWMWPGIVRGTHISGQPTGFGGKPLNGIIKHSALNWNLINTDAGKGPEDYDVQHLLYRRWTTRDAQRLKVANPAEATIIYCAIGEHMEGGARWIDKGSHPTSVGGGTNAAFGDMHVEWVEGTRIGWP